MTWNELAALIKEMPETDRGCEVIYMEPYDTDPEVYPVDLHKSSTAIYDAEDVLRVAKDEFFLQ